eukprot:CAMPEP_0119150134 /NCGR_PEP_ID=MMETSP1310-20130426/44331_1 /TAXON_ID=464262 /ORGANISM="Genus nov. species nov., Strain RCC2339" /LENGTH=247 /DNA_ID=CAMNT_0007142285 /DNA_START=9 /DNA_END=752 /DNA_ORIENTATION=+
MAGVVREEGFLAFYKGALPAVARQVLNSGLALFCYKPIRDYISKPSGGADGSATAPLHLKLAAAAASSAGGQFLSNPMDVLKVRLQSDGQRRLRGQEPLYRGVVHAFQMTMREGPKTFFRGCVPASLRSAVVGGTGLACYDQAKDVVTARFGLSRGSIVTHIACAGISGVVTSLVSTPLDVVKVRMMASRKSGQAGMTSVIRGIIATEGPLALMKGFAPTYTRLGPWQFVFFLVNEQVLARISGEWF